MSKRSFDKTRASSPVSGAKTNSVTDPPKKLKGMDGQPIVNPTHVLVSNVVTAPVSTPVASSCNPEEVQKMEIDPSDSSDVVDIKELTYSCIGIDGGMQQCVLPLNGLTKCTNATKEEKGEKRQNDEKVVLIDQLRSKLLEQHKIDLKEFAQLKETNKLLPDKAIREHQCQC